MTNFDAETRHRLIWTHDGTRHSVIYFWCSSRVYPLNVWVSWICIVHEGLKILFNLQVADLLSLISIRYRRPASQARGPRIEPRWLHSSFSLKSPDFVPVASRVAFSGMGQARIENNLLIYLLFISIYWIFCRMAAGKSEHTSAQLHGTRSAACNPGLLPLELILTHLF